jgi:hypothetical protein
MRLPTLASTHGEQVHGIAEAAERQAGAQQGFRQHIGQTDKPWGLIGLCHFFSLFSTRV